MVVGYVGWMGVREGVRRGLGGTLGGGGVLRGWGGGGGGFAEIGKKRVIICKAYSISMDFMYEKNENPS